MNAAPDTTIDTQALKAWIEQHGTGAEAAMPLLQAIQTEYNYLPQEALDYLCANTRITPAQITGIASFYSQFRLRPAGSHFVKVCVGTACHVKGADAVYDAFRRHLHIEGDNDTDTDRLFTVERVACLGCCMLAPAVQIDDVTYGPVEARGVADVLQDFLQGAETEASRPGVAGSGGGEIRICDCSSCVAAGSASLRQAFIEAVHERKLPVQVRPVGCTGISYETPLAEIVLPKGEKYRYGRVQPAQVSAILDRHFTPPQFTDRLRNAARRLIDQLYEEGVEQESIIRYQVDLRDGPDAGYWGSQEHLVTEHCGVLNPMDLEAYCKHDGFQALSDCLQNQTSAGVIEIIQQSGLRGRGGAGYPTGTKWANVAAAADRDRVIICNADEGDPGAFMDRMTLESFPFRVIEGMIIAAYAIGAKRGIVYVRAEYPLATSRLGQALETCRRQGYLGENIQGSGFDFDIRIVPGAGAFVCGEETALIAAVEGRRGTPRYRPPYPSESGLHGKPTLVNNVETLALVPWILRHGPVAFGAFGTEHSKGTKTFALAGKIVRGGLIEVPMGMTLREIVDDIGGGISGGRKLKAVQVGGPSGGCVPADLCDTPVDYEKLNDVGAIMGSGGMVVLDDTDCMVEVARYFMAFTQDESCGKCTFCRIGTKRMLDILENLTRGDGREGDVERLKELSTAITAGSLCGLGRTAPNPVLSTLQHFRDEYEAHLEGRCPAGKCKALIAYTINDDCIGCTRCAQNCPVDAIPLTPYEKHKIDADTCTRCDTCRQVCPVDAVDIE